jgi:acyl transferase domain-containing protein
MMEGLEAREEPALHRAARWDADVGWHEHDALNKRFGAFVDGAELFDARAFGVARPEAAAMDAQQRLLLEAAHDALAGSAPRDLTGLPQP